MFETFVLQISCSVHVVIILARGLYLSQFIGSVDWLAVPVPRLGMWSLIPTGINPFGDFENFY